MAARDAEIARYMPRSEAIHELGLTMATIVRVAAAGALRYVEGPERNFPTGCFFFLREDVMKIKEAFEKHSVPVQEYSNPCELIALRHAMKNYLGHGADLAAIIQAVIDGSLVPVGRTVRRNPGHPRSPCSTGLPCGRTVAMKRAVSTRLMCGTDRRRPAPMPAPAQGCRRCRQAARASPRSRC